MDKSTFNYKKKFIIQLIFTEQCNLRCKYCYEIDKSSRNMPIELAKNIIEFEMSQMTNDFDVFEIQICGGEPLLYFEDVKKIVEYVIENTSKWKEKIYFYIGTNLTLLNSEMKKWLEENQKWVTLGTSIDGTREAHNYYRCDSYDNVVLEIPFYKRLYPSQGVKMTIGPNTINSIFNGIINIESMGLNVSANVVFESVWGNIDNKKQYLAEFARQLDLLVQHYVDNPTLNVPNLLSLPINFLNISLDPDYRWCGSGRTMRAYDTEGRALPCHRFSRFSTNKIYEGSSSIESKVITKCNKCNFYSACPNCIGLNWQQSGHPDNRTSYHCEFIKLQLLATAKLHFLKNQHIITPDNVRNISANTLYNLKSAYFVFQCLKEEDIISNCEIGYPPEVTPLLDLS